MPLSVLRIRDDEPRMPPPAAQMLDDDPTPPPQTARDRLEGLGAAACCFAVVALLAQWIWRAVFG